jgi:hypothetical protein
VSRVETSFPASIAASSLVMTFGTTASHATAKPGNFGAGASGGSWLVDYNSSNGLGYIRTVTSFGPGSPLTLQVSISIAGHLPCMQ